MNDKINQNLAILHGDTIPKLNAAEKEKLSRAFFELFFGLSAANWARGADKKLGAAWYESIGQLKAMMATKDKRNPSAMYLQQILAAHSAKWSEEMMTNPNKDKNLELTSEEKQKWNADANKKIGDAMKTINESIARNKIQEKAKAPQPQMGAGNKFTTAQKMLLQKQIMIKILMDDKNQNAA